MVRQRGVSLVGLIVTLAVGAFIFVLGVKLVPAYIEYFSVKKMFSAMEANGDLKGSVREIRYAFEKRNNIENVADVHPDDLEITKEGGETVISVSWSKKVGLVANISACLDFFVTTAPQQPQ